MMQLPRGNFLFTRRDMKLGRIIEELQSMKFSGVCTISSGLTHGSLVFKSGKVVLAEFRNFVGDAALDEFQKIIGENVDASIGVYDDPQIALSIEFNKSSRIKRKQKEIVKEELEPYIPKSLPPEEIDWNKHLKLSGKANAALGRYNGLLQGIVNPQVFLAPLAAQEALSSFMLQGEGTMVSLEEVMQYDTYTKNLTEPEKRSDYQQIVNYRNAINAGIEEIDRHEVNIDTIKKLHRILLKDVRGQDREPGEIRDIQNFIGPKNGPPIFIPPSPDKIMGALTNWETYLRNDDDDVFVQIAILKAQFELIHPFRDGNGRIGRMLVTLLLYSKKVILTPTFYISGYFEKNRDLYNQRLLAISTENDWDGWIEFFIKGIIEQADVNNFRANSILKLYSEMKKEIPDLIESPRIIQVIDTIFSRPIFKAQDFIDDTKIPNATAQRILKDLTKSHILEIKEEGSGSRPTIYIFPRLISIVEGISLYR
jgi:Fic family protein